jgi:hypothetical protein
MAEGSRSVSLKTVCRNGPVRAANNPYPQMKVIPDMSIASIKNCAPIAVRDAPKTFLTPISSALSIDLARERFT